MTIWIIITIIAIILSGLFSGSEIAFVQSNKVKLEIDVSSGGVINGILKRFYSNADMFISTMLVGNNVVLVIYGITFSMLFNQIFEKWFPNSEALVLLVNTVVSTFIILITGEMVPKTAFRINPNSMLRVFSIPLYLIYIVLYPISMLVSWISKGLMHLIGIKNEEKTLRGLTMTQLDDYLQQSMEDHQNDEAVENEVKIFTKAVDFKDTRIDMCMVPRNEVEAVNINTATREELVKRFIATGLSKIVVYKDDIDDVQGYIHISELFDPKADWKEHLKPVIFTPTTMLAEKMMRRMLTEKRSMAIIIDEFGGTAGIVTLEDLVEEIFGEIEDEHDKNRLVARQLDENIFEISARLEIEAINEEFHLAIPESEEYNTLAGYILENLEAFPQEGDNFTVDNFNITILKMSSARIELVKIERLPADND